MKEADSDLAILWYNCLGHLNFGDINKMVRNSIVKNLPEMAFNKVNRIPCVEAKMTERSLSGKKEREFNKLETIHIDICGPFDTIGQEGEIYTFTLVDSFSFMTWIYPIRNKYDCYDAFTNWLNMVENQTGERVKQIHCDNAKEFVKGKFEAFCRNCGIEIDHIIPDKQAENGIAERQNQILNNAAKSMLICANLPKFFADIENGRSIIRTPDFVREESIKEKEELIEEKDIEEETESFDY